MKPIPHLQPGELTHKAFWTTAFVAALGRGEPSAALAQADAALTARSDALLAHMPAAEYETLTVYDFPVGFVFRFKPEIPEE